MNTRTDAQKIDVVNARRDLNAKLMAYKTEHINAQIKHWTYGKEHKPIADEIIVPIDESRYYVLFGIEYDDKGNVGALYKTDVNGKRTNLNISTVQNKEAQESLIAKRVDEIKKKEVKKQPATAEKTPAQTLKKVVKRSATMPKQDVRLS